MPEDANTGKSEGGDAGVVTVVSGLPRSGTSMMMSMLETGGLPILNDYRRKADADNPRGYYEFERVKKLKEDTAWLPEAVGKVVKVISFLLPKLPQNYRYRVIFMRRALAEVLASQRQMLIRRGEEADAEGDECMAELYARHVRQSYAWLAQQPHMDVLYVDYRRAVEEPAAVAEEVNAFLGGILDTAAMAAAVDPALRRHRADKSSRMKGEE